MNKKKMIFEKRNPHFRTELKSKRAIMCFVMHENGEPLYKSSEALWSKVNRQYQKHGYVKNKAWIEWVGFRELFWDRLVDSHRDWISTREDIQRYATISKRASIIMGEEE
jgi:hypothetical protein